MGEVSEVLYNIWNLIKDMTWQISIVILIVICCRVFVQKISKQACYFLWLIVAVRLLVPVMIPSDFSIFNWMEKPQLEQMNNEKTEPSISGTTDVSINEHEDISNEQLKQETLGNTQISEVHQTNPEPTIQDSNYSHMLDIAAEDENTDEIKDTVKNWDFILWISGMLFMFIYGIVSYLFLKHKLRFATKNQNGFMECDKISSPFVFGVLKPVIYLPYHLSKQEQNYILSHERYHIRRRDYLVKLFAFSLLAVYWFHPLVWSAFYLMSRDMETSCDEQVLKDLGIEDRKAYSCLLLGFASNKRYPLPSPLSFGENDVKSRIKQILNYKKPTFWGIIVVVVIITIVAVCCLTDAKSKDLEPETEMTEDEVLAFAEKLYDAKNPYIGDVYADRTIMSLLLEELGVTGFSGNEIQTYEEPYWISFSFDEEPNDNRMWQASAMFMALVDNAEEVRWTFYDEYETLNTCYVTLDSVNAYLEGKNLKDYADSAEQLAKLWDILDKKRTFAAIASGEYKSVLVATSEWERQANKAGLDFPERITWENRLKSDGIGYRGDDGYVAGCQYQDFDRNGMMDFAITIIDHQREEDKVSYLYIYMNDDPVYIYSFSIRPAFWNLQTADIDGDGYFEFIFSGDSGGTGGYGCNAFYAILKYKNRSFEEIPLLTDEYLERTEESHAGIGVEIYATDQKDTFEAYCPLTDESVTFSFVSESNPSYMQNCKKGDLVGREYYGFGSLSIVEKNGKTYLLGEEALYCENLDEWHGIEIMGYATFLLNWDETEGWIVKDYEVHTFEDENKTDDIATETAKKWAQAISNGDGQTIVSMASGEVIEQFQKEGVLERYGDNVRFSFGSSPMFIPWSNDMIPYTIVSQDDSNHTVDILYYTWTSDPHIYVWREQLTFTPTNDEYIVSKESIICYDNITTLEDFLLAYPMGIRETLMNYYEVNSLGEQLEKNALLSSNNLYKDLFDPALAACHLLNIGNKGKMLTEVETSGDVDSRSVKITFPDGIIEISVCRPYSENGIWIPYDYVVYKD